MKKALTVNIVNPKKEYFTQILLLAVMVLLVFGNTLFNNYNLDDNLVTQHHVFTSKGIAGIKQILQSNYYSNSADIKFGYRPITHISFALEHQFLGEKATSSHAVNLLLYLCVVLLFYKLMYIWFSATNKLIPFIAALLFAVHPLHTEVVASIKNRDEILALLFAILAAICANRYIVKANLLYLFNATLLFALAMLSKKSAFPLVLILPIISYLLNKQHITRCINLAVCLTLPAAIIGAEFELKKSIIITTMIVGYYAAGYFLTNINQYKSYLLKPLNTKYGFIVTITTAIAIFCYSLFINELSLTFASIIIALYSIKLNKANAMFILSLLNIALALYFDDETALNISLLFIGYSIFTNLSTYTKNIRLIILSIIGIASFFILTRDLFSSLVLVNICLFFYLIHRKLYLGILFIAISIGVSAITFKIPVYQFVLLGFTIYLLLKSNISTKLLTVIKPTLIIGLFIFPLAYIASQNKGYSVIKHNLLQEIKLSANNSNPPIINSTTQNTSQKESRTIHYIENTLVAKHSLSQNLATGLVTTLEYTKLMCYPYQLSFYYGYAVITTQHFAQLKTWLALLVFTLLVSVIIWQFNKNTLISIGLLWYLISILLFSNNVEIVPGMIGERLAFTASAGFCLALAALIIKIKPTFSLTKPRFIEFVLLIVVMLFSVKSFTRNSVWKNAITLMQNDITHLDKSAQAHNLLALNLMHESGNGNNSLAMQQQAIHHFKKSIEIYPYFFNTNFDLARAYFGTDDLANAKYFCEKSLQLDTENINALELMVFICYKLQLVIETEYYSNLFIVKQPNNIQIHQLITNAMLLTKNKDKAILYAQRALSYFPNDTELQNMLSAAQQLN